MLHTDRDVFIRNHVMGVLVYFSGKGLDYSNIGELADSITDAVMEGLIAWQANQCCEEFMKINEEVSE